MLLSEDVKLETKKLAFLDLLCEALFSPLSKVAWVAFLFLDFDSFPTEAIPLVCSCASVSSADSQLEWSKALLS